MMNDDQLFFVLDCESVGLHGECFAWGFVVVDRRGNELVAERLACDSGLAHGDEQGRAWIRAHVPMSVSAGGVRSLTALRTTFWWHWMRWKAEGSLLCADCAWPVEARFLAACVDDGPAARTWEGPYPLVDVASVRLAAGFDPLATVDRLLAELPVHDPLADARQSARLLIAALDKIGAPAEMASSPST